MKKTIHIIFSITLLFVGTELFAQQWHTSLDVLRPAAKTLPSNINNILLVNNAAIQPNDFGHATVLYGSEKDNQSIDLTQAPLRTLFATTEQLDFSKLFSSVSLLEHSQSVGSFFQTNSLTRQQQDSLMQLYDADAIFSLERIILYDKQEIYFNDYEYQYQAEHEVFATVIWTLFTTNDGFQSFAYSDTLYWETSSPNNQLALEQLPDRQTALLDVAEYIGELFAMQFVPQWETVDRYLYDNKNEKINAGIEQFTHKHWDNAITIWQEAYNNCKVSGKKSKTDYQTLAYSAANIAVTYEVLNNLEQAELWAKAAINAFDKINTPQAAQQQVNTTYYLKQLTQRQKEEKQLELQISNK